MTHPCNAASSTLIKLIYAGIKSPCTTDVHFSWYLYPIPDLMIAIQGKVYACMVTFSYPSIMCKVAYHTILIS